ncbi:helix-turn-helix domain-containing protein [Streptomyces sp. NPDC091292]|uniref:helix-turn-helix domain-containing protein n=1 Tax=Streptomyces sp. NPDC091292 TaxID=3365991 RepID=UPI0038203B58
MESTNAGENIAVLRKTRNMSQAQLGRAAGLSVSYVSKVETGLRPVTPAVAAACAKAMKVTTARIYGQPYRDRSQTEVERLDALRTAVRRHTLPKEDVPDPRTLAAEVKRAAHLRAEAEYLELLDILPTLLGRATATAFAAGGDAVAWGQVADLYGCAYAVAHRLGEPDLADMIVSRQQWAAHQTWNPDAEAAASWNEAGTYQSAGHYDDGLTIVDRAIVQYERGGVTEPSHAVVLGSLHLRGVVLASRHKDAAATEAHLSRARALAAQLPQKKDALLHNLTFGAGNTALYELAAHIELERPDQAVSMATPLQKKPPAGLKPSRIGRLHIDVARARLAIGDVTGAEDSLKAAFKVAPEMSELHPMCREVVRVLFVMHQRTRPDLMTMARRVGLTD